MINMNFNDGAKVGLFFTTQKTFRFYFAIGMAKWHIWNTNSPKTNKKGHYKLLKNLPNNAKSQRNESCMTTASWWL
jgi:hypothetical protein